MGIYSCIYPWGLMKQASLFLNNKTQSLRIPKEDQFSGEKVFFEKFGDIGILIDEKNPWAGLKLAQLLANGSFLEEGREVNPIIERQKL